VNGIVFGSVGCDVKDMPSTTGRHVCIPPAGAEHRETLADRLIRPESAWSSPSPSCAHTLLYDLFTGRRGRNIVHSVSISPIGQQAVECRFSERTQPGAILMPGELATYRKQSSHDSSLEEEGFEPSVPLPQ